MGPMQLKVFSNDPDDGTECILSKFVDNTKLEKAVNTLKARAATQRDLDKLVKWVARNIIKFSKSKILHVEQNNIMLQAGAQPSRKHLYRKGHGGPCGPEVDHKPAACACSSRLL